jgi:hypothetical protein
MYYSFLLLKCCDHQNGVHGECFLWFDLQIVKASLEMPKSHLISSMLNRTELGY